MTIRALVITSSILAENGQSNALANRFVEQANARNDINITQRDVLRARYPTWILASWVLGKCRL